MRNQSLIRLRLHQALQLRWLTPDLSKTRKPAEDLEEAVAVAVAVVEAVDEAVEGE
jgi:hypothetical protein